MATKTESTWVGSVVRISGVVLTIACLVGGVAATYIFATKGEVEVVKQTCANRHYGNEKSILILQQQQQYQTKEMTRMNTHLENIDAQQRVDSKNLEKLLYRMRVQPEDPPELKPIPKPSPPPMRIVP